MAEVGIIISLKDNATKGFSGIRSAIAKVSGSFSVLSSAMSKINQGLEIVRKAWNVLRLAVVSNIQAALQFRKETDPVRKWFTDMKKDTDALRAAIGDLFIPIVQSLAESFHLVGRGAQEWVDANRKIIASKILEWSISLARLLTLEVAKSIAFVARAWRGLEMLINGTKAVVESFFASMLEGVAKGLSAMARLSSAVGAEGMAASLQENADAVKGLGEVFAESSEQSTTAVYDSMNALDQQLATIDRLAGVVDGKLVKALKRARRAIEAFRTSGRDAGDEKTEDEEQKKRLAESLQRLDTYHKDRLAMIQQQNDMELSLALWKDQQIQKSQERMLDVTSGALNAMVGVASAAYGLMGESGDAFAKKMVASVIDGLVTIINAFAATVVANYTASLPPAIGTALGAVASSVIMGIGASVKAMATLGMADGGFVTGGMRGRDSVPVLAMPGEYVMSRGEVDGARKLVSRLLGSAAGQQAESVTSGRGGPGQGQTTIINQKTELRTWAPQLKEETEMARRLEEGARRRLRRQGMLLAT